MLRFYRCLIGLYPATYRERFGEEMIEVFREAQAVTESRTILQRAQVCLREAAGLLIGALRERVAEVRIWTPFSTRRFTMRGEFRFPKSTAVLMAIILAGVVVAIEKAKAIQASLSAANPQIGPIQPSHLTFLLSVAQAFVFFYAAGIIGWVLLFALRRSGVHRLADVSEQR